jgi:hypothetical protein
MWCGWMQVEFAETLSKSDLCLGRKFALIAKEYDLMIDQRLFDGGKLRIGKLR